MKILYLGSPEPTIEGWLREQRHQIIFRVDPIAAGTVQEIKPDWLLSYGYRHIIPESVLSVAGDRTINLHISLLPWNRGADPNFWSFADNTPKGVSIHRITPGIDDGPIYAREEVTLGQHHTLQSSYEELQTRMRKLFLGHAARILSDEISPSEQVGKGTYHRARDRLSHWHHFPLGWMTPVSDIRAYFEERNLG